MEKHIDEKKKVRKSMPVVLPPTSMGIHPDLIQRLNRLDSLENENRSLRERNTTLEAELAALRINRKNVGTDVRLVLTGEAVEEIDRKTARGEKVDLDSERFGL